MKYVDLKEHQNARLAFEALKYLGSLLCHKKFATEFTNAGKLLYMQVWFLSAQILYFRVKIIMQKLLFSRKPQISAFVLYSSQSLSSNFA